MADPKVLDFSAEKDEAITIVFPDGETTCELPTVDELSMSALQFLTGNGEEWYELFAKSDLTAAERKRFDHLNEKLIVALLDEVPKAARDQLSSRQKAKVIVGFMTASPNLLQTVMAEARQQTTAS